MFKNVSKVSENQRVNDSPTRNIQFQKLIIRLPNYLLPLSLHLNLGLLVIHIVRFITKTLFSCNPFVSHWTGIFIRTIKYKLKNLNFYDYRKFKTWLVRNTFHSFLNKNSYMNITPILAGFYLLRLLILSLLSIPGTKNVILS